MDMSIKDELVKLFPNFALQNFSITSPDDPGYNCVAWAADDNTKWWEPDPFKLYYWPPDIPRKYTLAAYESVYKMLGYVECNHDESYESGFQKVALFAKSNQPKHASKQIDSERWSSKLGGKVDIEHQLHGLEGSDYGTIASIMKKPV